MNMDCSFISKTEIFLGITAEETAAALECLQAYTGEFKKGEMVCKAGNKIDSVGLVLSGSVNIEQCDVWGNVSILGNVCRGEVFGEAYACAENERLLVDVIAAEKTEVLFLNIDKILRICHSACQFHTRMIRNMLSVMVEKNLNLSRKISHTTSKSIQGRLLAYLSDQSLKYGRYSFEIPFNRQQLADYLCVDRSAMSNVLSKMKKEGVIGIEKNIFTLK